MNRRIAEIVGSVAAIVIFVLALFVLYHQLHSYRTRDISEALANIPSGSLAISFFLAFLSYLALSGYDVLALRHIHHPLPYSKVAVTSFTTYSVSHSLGFSLFTGGSVRYRVYGVWGLSVLEITSVMGFAVVTFWLGYLTSSAISMISNPVSIPPQIRLPFSTTLPLGVFFAFALLAYLGWVSFAKKPIKIKSWSFEIPSVGTTLTQMALGLFDWLVASAALYVLLPGSLELNFGQVFGIFLLSQIAGVVSNVPGGLGVFETVFLLLAGTGDSRAQVFSALLAYRIIYYVFPLFVAAITLATFEVRQRRVGVARIASSVQRWVSIIAPRVTAVTIFIAGLVLLFSGATPALSVRVAWLLYFIPIQIVNLSHFLGSIIGLCLLVLAQGLYRRVDAAYLTTLVLLVAGIAASLLKGFDYEEATVLGVMFFMLLPARSFFYRKSALLEGVFSPSWVGAIAIAITASVWLTFFSFKHVDYSQELWWQFGLSADASRSLRAEAGVALLALFLALKAFLKSPHPIPVWPTPQDLDSVTPLIKQSSQTTGHLALIGDKELLMSENGRAFIMYRVLDKSWIAMGDPVGDEPEWPDLLWRFNDMADSRGGFPVFYQTSERTLPLYLDLGLTGLKLGEEARIPLDNFSLEGHANKPLRHWHRKPESEGCSFQVVDQTEVKKLLPTLRRISDDWLEQKNVREKRFSLGAFSEEYLERLPAALVFRDGRIIAFANIWEVDNRYELSVDLMRHSSDAPTGVMDFLIIELMLWGKRNGFHWFNLGMAPLSGLDGKVAADFWNQLGTFLYRHGEHFYNFQGLRQYKEKFKPVWEPRYLVSPGGVAVFRILANVATAISGGMMGVVKK